MAKYTKVLFTDKVKKISSYTLGILIGILIIMVVIYTERHRKEQYKNNEKKDNIIPYTVENSNGSYTNDLYIVEGHLKNDRHQYLTNGGGNQFVFIHYPSCKYCKSK